MTPTSPSDSDRLPLELADALAALPQEERDALVQTWHAAARVSAPPPDATRKAATWAALQPAIASPSGPRRAPRSPVRRARPRRLHPAALLSAGLLVAAGLAWALVAGPPLEVSGAWRGAAGEGTLVHLPDGSRVHLDAGATLRTVSAGADARAYTLSGTATFEVARNERRPFQVQTERVDIAVLGTTFRVAAEDARRTRVVVHEGRVAVAARDQRVEAGKGEQVIAAGPDEPLVVRAQPQSAAALFAQHDAPLRTVLREIELLFDLRITYPGDAAAERLTITRHGPLEARELLQSVCAPLGLRFRPAPGGFEVYRPG